MNEYTATVEVDIENGVDGMADLSMESAAAIAEHIAEQAESGVDVSGARVSSIERAEGSKGEGE